MVAKGSPLTSYLVEGMSDWAPVGHYLYWTLFSQCPITACNLIWLAFTSNSVIILFNYYSFSWPWIPCMAAWLSLLSTPISLGYFFLIRSRFFWLCLCLANLSCQGYFSVPWEGCLCHANEFWYPNKRVLDVFKHNYGAFFPLGVCLGIKIL